jgi:hypothetical protein
MSAPLHSVTARPSGWHLYLRSLTSQHHSGCAPPPPHPLLPGQAQLQEEARMRRQAEDELGSVQRLFDEYVATTVEQVQDAMASAPAGLGFAGSGSISGSGFGFGPGL